MGLTLDEVVIMGERLSLGHDPFSIGLDKPGTMEVRVSDLSLAAFLNEKTPIRDAKIRFDKDQIHVEGRATVVIPIGFSAVCSLRIEDDTKLYVELVRMESIGGSGAVNIVQRQLDSINPVIDLADFPLDATISSVAMEKDWLVLKGTIAPR